MNRIDPALFRACFEAWVAERWPQAPALGAPDGKTSRGSREETGEQSGLHLVSAFATDRNLVLGQGSGCCKVQRDARQRCRINICADDDPLTGAKNKLHPSNGARGDGGNARHGLRRNRYRHEL
jgi:hypothetical protein